MIQESVREMTAEERESLRRSMQAAPPAYRLPSTAGPAAAGLAAVAALAAGAAVWTGGAPTGGLAAALAGGALYALYRLAAALREDRRRRARHERFRAESARELARVLEDGRVTVKRVRAVAVVEIEPFEDEGPGYVFDLGDGRTLFLKGQDYSEADEETPWPNTDFEIVRTAANGRLFDLRCHGAGLPPLRVVRSEDVDPEAGWDDREVVLRMSVDEAVRTVLRKP